MTQACALIVQSGDPDRFRAAMSAPPAARGPMFVLFAFNLEIAKAPWASKEPLIAEMRLQWWHDVLTRAHEGNPPAHEVAGPLVELIRARDLDIAPLLAAVAARRLDIDGTGLNRVEPLLDYLDGSTAGILWTAARALGEDAASEPAFRRAALAGALANYLTALPAIKARRRVGFSPERVQELARIGLAAWQDARGHHFGAAKPVLRSLWQTPKLLQAYAADPVLALEGRFTQPEAAKRGRLLWLTLTSRW